MKKRIIAVMLAVLCTAISGCSDKSDKNEQETTFFTQPQYEWGQSSGESLTIWTQEGELDRIYMQRAFARYEQSTGNHLEIVQIPKDAFVMQTAEAMQNASGPDILLSYGGANIAALQPDQNFYDFTNAVWVDDLTDTSINQTIYHGKVVGLPHWEASISGTIYNKKIFEKYGLSVPKTQQEFLDVCEKLKQNGITPMYLPGKEISMLLYQFPLDTLVQDSDTLQALNTGALRYDELDGMKTVVEWYRLMAQQGYFGQSYLQNDWDGMSGAMQSGQYAMMLCWDTWLYTDYEGDASEFGLMPAFVGIPDKGTFEGPNLALLIVNQNGPKLDAALDFITFMADPYNYNAAFDGIYTAPVFKNQVASISTPQYIETERLIEQQFCDSIAWLRIRGFSQMDASCILEYMQNLSVTPEQCLRRMDDLRRRRAQ